LQPVCAAVAALAIGVYAEQVGVSATLHNDDIGLAVRALGWVNALIVIAAVATILERRLAAIPGRTLREETDQLITEVLAAACKTFVYPRSSRHIRAIVTLRNGKTGRRCTRYTYNAHQDPERVASYPLAFGVTGQAYKTRSTVVQELQPDHHSGYDERIRDDVLPEICSILASPILASSDESDEPLGVLAFDSTLHLSEIGFDREEARELAQRWADIVAMLLNAREGEKWRSE